MGCKAHNELTEYVIYPEYAVLSTSSFTLINKTQRKFRENRLAELRDALANDYKITTEHKYYVCLLSCEAHHMCHPTGREIRLAQRVHPAIIQKIRSLVLDDISDPFEVQHHLQHYVHHFLCLSNLPDPLDEAYYPNLQAIRNHISNEKRTLLLSVIDQENVSLKVKQWNDLSPESKFFFRPYKTSSISDDEDIPQGSGFTKSCGNRRFCYDMETQSV